MGCSLAMGCNPTVSYGRHSVRRSTVANNLFPITVSDDSGTSAASAVRYPDRDRLDHSDHRRLRHLVHPALRHAVHRLRRHPDPSPGPCTDSTAPRHNHSTRSKPRPSEHRRELLQLVCSPGLLPIQTFSSAFLTSFSSDTQLTHVSYTSVFICKYTTQCAGI
jgi:hypothetical protein